MQQQFFKTMEHAFFGSKSLQSSKVGKARPQANQKSAKYFVDFELAQHQLSAMQLKLPKGFFLINPNNGDLQKIRSEYKSNFVQKDTAGSKHNLIKAKKEQKKMESKERLVQAQQERKAENKQGQKSGEVEKPKKEKKDTKGHGRKLIEQKSAAEIQQNMQEVVEQIQKQELGEKKPEEGVKRKHKQGKQKKHSKEPAQQKQAAVQPSKTQLQGTEKQAEKIVVKCQMSQPKQAEAAQEGHLSIPFLANNAPRYDPVYYNTEVSGSLQENTLCYYFGLPYSGTISESAPRLNEKQKKFCNNIIQRLKNHRSSQAFRVPVDPQSQGVPDYYSIVYMPMDLRTIQKKINKDRYHYISEFHADINMIFLNSYKYNLRQTVYFQATVQFEDYYHELLREAKRNPDEYTKEYVSKFNKPRNDSGELDYTQHTPKKQRKKNESIRMALNMTKSQILDKERKNTKLLKNRSMFEDQSGALSHSFALETINDFNVDNLAADNESKMIRKQQKEFKSKIKKVESIQLPIKEVVSEIKQKMQMEKPQKPQKPQKLQKLQKLQKPDATQKITDKKMEDQGRKCEQKRQVMIEELSMQAEQKEHKTKRYGNDDYNDEDNYLMDNLDGGFEISQNSGTNKGAPLMFQAINPNGSMEAERTLQDRPDHQLAEQKMINQPVIPPIESISGPAIPPIALQKKLSKVGRKNEKQQKQTKQAKQAKKQKEQKSKQQQIAASPAKSTLQSSSIAKQTPRFSTTEFPKFFNPSHQTHNFESIIVNNINALPQSYLAHPIQPFHGSVDIFTENTQHPNSGATAATVALTNAGSQMESKVSTGAKNKKAKPRNKNVDEQYRCESDDDYVVESSRAHARRNKEKKITKSRMHKESSNSGDNPAYPPQRKRGRQPKRIPNESHAEELVKSSGEKELNQPMHSFIHEQIYHTPNIDALELPNYIPDALIPHEALLPFGNDYEDNELMDHQASIFYQNSRQESNQQNSQNGSKMV